MVSIRTPSLHLVRSGAFGAALCFTALGHGQNADDNPGSVPTGPGGAVVRPAEPPPAAAPATVEPPKLVHFENAPYPDAARKAGVQGTVLLKLTIDVTGAVPEAEVVQGLGYGLDEAAQQAALKFRFQPARRGGTPVPVKIQYAYTFTLQPAQVAPEPPKVGELGGVLRIADTGGPLAGAEVTVSGPAAELTLQSDGEGRWRVPNLAPGSYRVTVKATGFEPVISTEEVVAGEATDLTFRLIPQVEAEALEVVVEAERPLREVTRRTLERREIDRIPGTRGDALRSIESLPGVARPPGLAGLIIVRGSAPEDTATLVDGTYIPLIYHFGGLTTVFPTEILERYDFYPGNFSARYGQQMGGIIDVALREPNTRCTKNGKQTDKSGCFHGFGQVDLIDGRLLLEGPIAGDWSFIVGARRSWIDTWITPVLEEADAGVTSAPVYYDYQLIVERKMRDNGRLSLRFYGSDDRFEIVTEDTAAQDPAFGGRVSFGTAFYRAQAIYEQDLTSAVRLYSMLAVGRGTLDFGLGNFLFKLDSYPVQLRNEFGWKLMPGVQVNTGMDLIAFPYEVEVRFPQPPRPGEPDPGPFATRPPQESKESKTGFRPAWYVEAELQPTRKLRIVPGFRVDYARDSGHADFSPRINARYDIVSSTAEGQDEPDAVAAGTRRLRTTVKGGVGVFYQPPQFQETDDVFGTPNLESNRSIHYALGLEQELTRNIEASLEGFYKDFDDLVSRDTDPNGSFRYGNEGFGAAYGIEALIKYRPDDHFFGWVAYTLSKSVRQDGPDEEERPFEFDQTHNLSVLGSYQLGKGWELGGRFRLVSGALTTPVLQPPALPALYAADAGAYAPLQGEPFSERLPTFHQLDVRVQKTWQFPAWRLSGYFELINAYNNPAVEGLNYSYNYTQRSYAEGLPILPNIGVRGEF